MELFQQIQYTEQASFVRSIQQIQAVQLEAEVVEEKRQMEVMEAIEGTTMEEKMEEVTV